MSLICKGSRPSLEILYDRYHSKLLWFAGSLIPERAAAEDAVHEVFIKLIDKPELFDQNKKFSTWIYTVTANHCRNILRNESNRRRLLSENAETEPTTEEMRELADEKALKAMVAKSFEQMSAKEKSLYVLRFDENMPLKEIAAVLAIPEGSVKSGIFHMLKKLGKQLKQFSHE
jgi:RNA polymerase sigma-70 factor, ECF subfamily